METIGSQAIWSFVDGAADTEELTCTQIRKGAAHKVRSYLELACKTAELQFMNRGFALLFRGQRTDHKNLQRNTSLKPSLLRPSVNSKENPSSDVLIRRFDRLRRAEDLLVNSYLREHLGGSDLLKRNRTVRWAILQHYEICRTPLLDVTQSLRIAASFASIDAEHEAYVFVLGVPNLSGAISTSAEAGLQMVRLASVCPPKALRPHIQEGFLLGEYPEMSEYAQKELYRHYEIDFGRRLVAKFRFDPRTFWTSEEFPMVSELALYPSPENDVVRRMANEIKQRLKSRNKE